MLVDILTKKHILKSNVKFLILIFMANDIIKFSQKNIPKIKAGMFWYYDETFSVDLLDDKKIKAVVELVDPILGVVYGDILIPDKKMKWAKAEKYIEFFNEYTRTDDYWVRKTLCEYMVSIFAEDDMQRYILEFVRSKHVGSPNAKICLYNDFQYLDVKSSAEEIKAAFAKLHKTSRFDKVKGFFNIKRKRNYWTETAGKREQWNCVFVPSIAGLKMYVRPVLAMAIFEW